MKVYKIAQNSQTQQTNKNNAAANESIQKLLLCVQTINSSLQILQGYDISKLLQKDTLINEIQSGNLQALDVTKIQASVDAMAKIVTVVPTFNAAMKALRDSGANISMIQNQIISLIQQGSTVQNNALSMFQNALPSSSGVQLPSNLSN